MGGGRGYYPISFIFGLYKEMAKKNDCRKFGLYSSVGLRDMYKNPI